MTQQPLSPPICDYEGSGYEADFWQGQGRDYEDRVERIALRRLLPVTGRRALEIGAGYGRLTSELDRYGHVVLLDYSRTMLARARARLGDDHYTYVAADIYHMPFQPGQFDIATMIRVIHHLADVPLALANIRQVLAPGAAFILEYANKRNLKAILRRAAGRQAWNPGSLEPVELIPLNFNFHPAYMLMVMRESGFDVRRRLAVSYFRLGALKRVIPGGALAAMDGAVQTWAPLYSPSVFSANEARPDWPGQQGPAGDIDQPLAFRCPVCGGDLEAAGPDELICLADTCGRRWVRRDGIYDFKEPL